MIYLSYIVTIISIIGTVANSPQKRWCFLIWICTNSFWIVFNIFHEQYSQALLYLFNLAMAIVGLKKWKRRIKPPQKSIRTTCSADNTCAGNCTHGCRDSTNPVNT